MSHSSSERKKMRMRKAVSATIGYCFVIVLSVLFVMSSLLSQTYLSVLEAERGDSLKSLAVSCSTALSHTEVSEGMTYPLPIYTYGKDKSYIFDVYTKAGNSFLRLYSSSGADTTDQYTITGAGDEYNECFDQQSVALTRRTENSVDYVCAIAPIISTENTVAGILEVRMPAADFSSTVNGMSLSWIFTIFAIAVSMGILIYEFNLLISTLSRGIVGNVPVLIMYGSEACRFLTFFLCLSTIMQPVVLSMYFKDALAGEKLIHIELVIGIAYMLYAWGFFGFKGLKKSLKYKLTSKVALVAATAFGYFLSVLSGLIGNPYVLLALILPISLSFGLAFDYLRDYRINASNTGYKGFDDRSIHNLQNTAYFLGVSVGTVIAGMFYERFGLLIVMIVSGACVILTSLAMLYFMRNNNIIREAYLPVNLWLTAINNKFTGRLLLSTFLVIGAIVSFMLCFVPNYLETVGISLATSAFYYLLTAFFACFVMTVIKHQFEKVLTSKVRVLISSACAILGFLLFALLPTAKVLCITMLLFGMSLGIHDFTYLYVLAKLALNNIRANLRKCCELTFFCGFILAIPVFSLAISLNIRLVMVIFAAILAIFAFVFPLSSVSDNADDPQGQVRAKVRAEAIKKSAQSVSEAEYSGSYNDSSYQSTNNEPSSTINQTSYNQTSYNQAVYDQNNYNQTTYNQSPYGSDGFDNSINNADNGGEDDGYLV